MVSNPSNHNTPTQTERRVFIRMEARTYLNPFVSHVPLFFASMSTPTIKSSHKSMTVGAHHGAQQIKLHESNCVSINNQVSPRLQVVSGLS
jgi:hypothetical protein